MSWEIAKFKRPETYIHLSPQSIYGRADSNRDGARIQSIPEPPIDRLVQAAREGYRFAQQHDSNWFAGVNLCPYGPGIPGRHLANAWYKGWWFWFYIVKAWREVA